MAADDTGSAKPKKQAGAGAKARAGAAATSGEPADPESADADGAGPDADASPSGPSRFARRVLDAVAATGPLCVGIDPSPDLLSLWGLPDSPHGLAEFSARCLAALGGVVPVVKPQVAWFERHGSAGLATLEALLEGARSAGLLSIADAKRGDVDVTMKGYADAWLADTSPLAADAVTTHAYLGLDALRAMFDLAQRLGRGVIVVARSSNPEGTELQGALSVSGKDVGDLVLAGIAERNRAEVGRGGLGSTGAVVGATRGPSLFDLTTLGGVILAPGVGAEGAGPHDVARLFAGCPAVLPSVSRSVLSAGPSPTALRVAARAARDAIAAAMAEVAAEDDAGPGHGGGGAGR